MSKIEEAAVQAKKWSEVTGKEIYRIKQQQCAKCYYFSRAQGDISSGSTCDYILIEGHRRGCSPLQCQEKGIFKLRPRTRTRRKAIAK